MNTVTPEAVAIEAGRAITEGIAAVPGADVFQELLNKVSRIEARQAAPQVQPMELRSFDELERWAERAARTDMVPKSYKGRPDDIILAVQMGAELGLRPMQSLSNIATVNGRPSVWGDAMMALCMQHPLYGGTEEEINGEGDDRTATCIAHRKGDIPKKKSFSVADAKRAGLFRNEIWLKYTDRMLQMRARGFALRDAFPDKLRGLISTEEAADYTPHSAAPSLEAAILAQHADAVPNSKPRQVEHDPKIVRWVEDSMKVLNSQKTLKAVNVTVDQIISNLDELRTSAPDLAQTLSECIAANRERVQKAAPEQNRADYAAEPKPEAPLPSGFEHFLIDEFGEPVVDTAGEILTIATGMQFANAFAVEAAKTGSIDALRENNADAIADAGADKNAALIIQAALDGAKQRTAKPETKASEPAGESTALPLGKTAGGKPHYPNYLEAAKKQIAMTASQTSLGEWAALNSPIYKGTPVEAGVEKAIREHGAAMAGDAPKRDHDLEWAKESVTWINDPKNTYDAILKWAMGTIPQAKMPRLKAERAELYTMVRDAIDGRKG